VETDHRPAEDIGDDRKRKWKEKEEKKGSEPV
jgi:hypothetical protein